MSFILNLKLVFVISTLSNSILDPEYMLPGFKNIFKFSVSIIEDYLSSLFKSINAFFINKCGFGSTL